jgi:hypothetical protein
MSRRITSLLGLFGLALIGLPGVSAETLPPTATEIVYFDDAQLSRAKAAIAAGDPRFGRVYQQLLAEADALLVVAPDPVVNKSRVPPSGDKHDYLSYAPYRWPDETKADGLPWIARDGIINPVARGPDTDHERLHAMFDAVEKLSFAFYFSGERKYAEQTLAHLNAWFIDPQTRVNPHVQFAQSVPGLPAGNPAAFIDWRASYQVLTAVQLLDRGGAFPREAKAQMDDWLRRYLDYMTTSEQGRKTDQLSQNHATWHNCQAVGLMIYLGRIADAKAKLQEIKTARIASQILPSGEQPRETGRTKSMHYASMNLLGLTNLTYMGRKLGIDLWAFETADGRSLSKAFRYLEPYARREVAWPFVQITPGGAEAAIDAELRPLFRIATNLLDLPDFAWSHGEQVELPTIERLQYPSR